MAFRYLNSVCNYPNNYDMIKEKELLINNVKERLSKLSTDDNGELSRENSAKAYAIIIEYLVEQSPIFERREIVWELARHIPYYFFNVIKDIARNCT